MKSKEKENNIHKALHSQKNPKKNRINLFMKSKEKVNNTPKLKREGVKKDHLLVFH